MKDIELIDNNIIRHEVFSLFDEARELYNMYYVYNEGNYTKDDYKNIKNIISTIEEHLFELNKEMN